MKNAIPLLLSAGFIAVVLTGCVTSPGGALVSAHTLETGQGRDLLPPDPTNDHMRLLPAYLTSSDAVADLDKRDVLQRFGRPAERLTPDLWIYWRYHSPENAAENGGHDTLVIAFTRGRVSTMKLVQGDMLRAHLAGAWRSPEQLAQR